MKFREHRGSLADSLKTGVELPDRAALLEHVRKLFTGWPTAPEVTPQTPHVVVG